MKRFKIGKHKNCTYIVFKKKGEYYGYFIDREGKRHFEDIKFHSLDNMVSYLIFAINEKVS